MSSLEAAAREERRKQLHLRYAKCEPTALIKMGKGTTLASFGRSAKGETYLSIGVSTNQGIGYVSSWKEEIRSLVSSILVLLSYQAMQSRLKKSAGTTVLK